jgi:drug/metabolite transporter (DMT)-like permease
VSPLPLSLVLLSTFMHAGWNLLARRQRGTDIFLPMTAIISGLGILPVVLAEWLRPPILPVVWPHLLAAGVCQAVYYFGLLRGYRSGDFTVVYPVARSLPVLALALVDVAQGRPPSGWGWLGIALIAAGCTLAPLEGWGDFHPGRYLNPATVWILVTAGGMIGYTLVDRAAAQRLTPGAETAVRYGLFEIMGSCLFYWLALRLSNEGKGVRTEAEGIHTPHAPHSRDGSRTAPTHHVSRITYHVSRITLHASRSTLMAAFLMFGAYSLVLWAYQLAEQVSYVVALRQFSIVLGVGTAAVLFHEPAPRWRISMAVLIVVGVGLIGVGG